MWSRAVARLAERRTSGCTSSPHQGQRVASGGAPLGTAAAAIVMLHGRGATADDLLSLAPELERPDFAYLAPEASGNTWYPNSFLAPLGSNQPWLASALAAVADVLEVLPLGFGSCKLEAAVPEESPYRELADLAGAAVATVYPRLTASLLPVEVTPVDVSGSVEIAPRLGLADAIVDLVSSGNTLRPSGLRSFLKPRASDAPPEPAANPGSLLPTAVERAVQQEVERGKVGDLVSLDLPGDHGREVGGDRLARDIAIQNLVPLRSQSAHAYVCRVSFVARAGMCDVDQSHLHQVISTFGCTTLRSMSAGQKATISCTRGLAPP